MSLNRDQQRAITDLLPRGFSLQPLRTNRTMEDESVAGDNPKSKPKPKDFDSKSSKDNRDPDYKGSHTLQMQQREVVQQQQPMVKVESTPSLVCPPQIP